MHEIKETFDFAKRQISISEIYDANVDVVLFEGNCDELIRHIPSESVDLVITSPPYNLGKKYEKKTTLQTYLNNMEPVISETKANTYVYWKPLLAGR